MATGYKFTRPDAEQLKFTSAKTGDHALDVYLEDAEKGGRTLAALMGDVFNEFGERLEYVVPQEVIEARAIGDEIAANRIAAADSEDAAKLSEIAAESARDSSLIQAGVYVDEPTGRAAVANGEAFKVQGTGLVAAIEYRRVDASSSTLLTSYPSVAAYTSLVEVANTSQALLDSKVSVATQQAEISTDQASASATSAFNALSYRNTAGESADAAALSASAASGSASTALTQAGIATDKASTATIQAGTAITKAGEAASSALSASGSAGVATTQAGTATTKALQTAANAVTTAGHVTSASASATTATSQASIATTKASEASGSATAAASSAASAAAIVLGVASNRASIRPTLLLDFAKTKLLDPRVDFSRASTATVFDERGVMQTVAAGVPRFHHDPATGESLGLLMEESRTNLLTYSDRFERSSSLLNARIFANSVVAPNGEFTGTRLTESFDTTINAHYLAKTGISALTGAHTIAIYAKASGRTGFGIAALGGSNDYAQFFNLDNGTLYTESISGQTPPDLQSSTIYIGGGWYKCVMSFTGNGQTTIRIYLDNLTGSATYQGDGVSGIYIWRAGLEEGSFPTSSIETPATFTGRASTATFIGSNGLIQTAATGVARYQYTPSDLTIPPYLLLESAGTNLFLQSQTLSNSPWTRVNAALSSVTDSDLSWQSNRVTATDTVFPRVQQNTALDAGSTYALSILVKAGSTGFMHGTLEASTVSQGIRFYANLTTGATTQILNQGTISATSSRKLISGGYYLYTWIIAVTSTANYVTFFGPSSSYTSNTAVVNDYIDVGYAQIELGSYATSVIPTTTSQVTRAADTSTSAQVTRAADSALMTGVNFSSWYRQDEGTFVASAYSSTATTSISNPLIQIDDGSINNRYLIYRISPGTSIDASALVGGQSQAKFLYSTFSSATKNTISFGFKFNDFASSANGSNIQTDTVGSLPTVNTLRIGLDTSGRILNGVLSKLAFYPKRLPNTELQGITS
jgi:hypothetical protein